MFDWLRQILAVRGAERKFMAWHAPGRPVWSARDPAIFAREGYAKNAIAYRCVRMIAEAAASAPLKVGPDAHPLARVLARPNPEQTGVELLEAFFGHLQVSGNAYLEAAAADGDAPTEIYVLRPDRMSVIPGADGWPVGWEHRAGANVRRFERDPATGDAPILHLKLFHPADARPHPAFPARAETWADASSWRLGHWLNGRAGLSDLGDVVRDLCARGGAGDADVSTLRGAVTGYVADSPANARDLIEPLMSVYRFDAVERNGRLEFFHRGDAAVLELTSEDFTAESAGETVSVRGDEAEAPIEARLLFLDAARDYLIAGASARRLDRADGGVETVEAPLVLEPEAAELLARRLLVEKRAEQEALRLELGPGHLALEPGDIVSLRHKSGAFEVVRVEDAEARVLTLRRTILAPGAQLGLASPGSAPPPAWAPSPAFSMLDLPPLPGSEDDDRPLAAVFAAPWLGAHAVYAGPGPTQRASVAQQAMLGELVWDLWPGPVDRWDQGNVVRVRFYGGGMLDSVGKDALLAGENAFAIEADGEWEVMQALQCALVAPNEYVLSSLLRGRLGSAHAMRAPHRAGARIVKIDSRLARVDVGVHEWLEAVEFIAPPAGGAAADPRAMRMNALLPHAALRPWAPAHVRAKRQPNGDVAVSWIRCARAGGDAWGPGEPPLGASSENYLLDILQGAAVKRSVGVAASAYLYSAADQVADFGVLPSSLHLRVAQADSAGAPGLNTELTITL